jgi:ELWxxDGT repeat protein
MRRVTSFVLAAITFISATSALAQNVPSFSLTSGCNQNKLGLFAGTDADGIRGLWVTDGTAAGTYEITGIVGAFAGGIFGGSTGFVPDFTSFNGAVVFSGSDSAGKPGLFLANGSPPGPMS